MLFEKPVTEGSIVSIKLITGEEVIAKLVEDSVMSYKISKPVILSSTSKGMAFVPYLLTVSMDKDLVINKHAVVALSATDKDFANQYIQSTTGIALPG
jgi:hypothetical protein